MATTKHSGKFNTHDDSCPECTQFVVSDVTLDTANPDATPVNATIEAHGKTSTGQPRILLTVWNSGKKPTP